MANPAGDGPGRGSYCRITIHIVNYFKNVKYKDVFTDSAAVPGLHSSNRSAVSEEWWSLYSTAASGESSKLAGEYGV